MSVPILFRPKSRRLICGVAASFAERYSVPIWSIRCVIVAGLIVSPVVALWYLLFAIAIPSEDRIVSQLQFDSEATFDARTHFEKFSAVLSERSFGRQRGYSSAIAIGLLLFAGLLELPQIEGVNFYAVHPALSSITSLVLGIGQPVFFCSVAVLLLLVSKGQRSNVFLCQPQRSSFSLVNTPQKMVAGIVAGAAQVLEIDPAFLRAGIILLNFLTIGLAGAAYLGVWYYYRRESAFIDAHATIETPFIPEDRTRLRSWASIFIFALGAISLSTQYRLYFFNLSLIESVVLIGLGVSIVWIFLRMERIGDEIWTLLGALLFLCGVYQLAMNIAHIQFSVPARLEIAEIIVGLSFIYVAISCLVNKARRLGFILAGVMAISALLISINIVPPRYLSEIERFYSFFYPIIFAGIGLWIAFEK